MWPLDNPDITAKKSFKLCLSGITDAAFRTRLQSIEHEIINGEIDYVAAAKAQTLHQIIPTPLTINGIVENKEMVKVYNQWLVALTSKGRVIYDKIMTIPKYGRCPYCGHRKVSTLDHMLSKTQYSPLTVTPRNLVASCFDCNKIKPGSACTNAHDVYLHAYYDLIDNHRWLFARFSQVNSSSLEFFITPHASWSADLTARAQNQFNKLGLNSLYQSNAAEELLNIRDKLQGLFNAGGTAEVSSHLKGEFETRCKARLNSWQTATYDAFFQDNSFCNRGFRLD